MEKIKYIVIKPTLDDLFGQMVYKHVENEQTYMIPLWHHELVYDNNGSELYFQCIPQLPINMAMDEYNHLWISVEIALNEIWKMSAIKIPLGKNTFYIARDTIKMKEKQLLEFIGCGIPAIDTQNIYNVTKRSNIYIRLTITT
jgi:hypothetical protein